MNEFQSPSIDYAAVSPLLIVFGVAVIGVLVEAFAPRRVRYVVQSVLALAGLAAAFAATVWVATDLTERGDGAAYGSVVAEGAIAVDGPSLFLWGTLLVLSLHERDAVRRAAPRRRR